MRSWLFRIFRNAMLDWARNIRRTEVPLLDVEEPPEDEDFAERHALREAIGAALAALPPILREAFLLRHELGHSYEEIAELAGSLAQRGEDAGGARPCGASRDARTRLGQCDQCRLPLVLAVESDTTHFKELAPCAPRCCASRLP